MNTPQIQQNYYNNQNRRNNGNNQNRRNNGNNQNRRNNGNNQKLSGLRQNNLFKNSNKNETNFLLIGAATILGLFIIIILYYVLNNKDTSSSNNSNSNSNNNAPTTTTTPTITDFAGQEVKATQQPMYNDTTTSSNKQVFHISDNLFAYDDAEAVCRAHGADLATYKQMVEAYKQGANWCNYGWVKGQMALYPIQPEHYAKMLENTPDKQGECGQPGINGGYFENKNLQFGVNCYGKKRGPKGDEVMKRAYLSDKEQEIRRKVAAFKAQIKNFKLTPWNENKWSGC